MWEHLKQEQKEKYKTLITNFASLRWGLFTKAEVDEKSSAEDFVAPIVNSKFQETVFQRAFKPLERILLILPMMLRLLLMKTTNILLELNHLVLIQATKRLLSLRKDSQSWNELLSEITFYAEISPDKESADRENYGRYEKLARKIATFTESTNWIFQSID